MGFGNGMAIGWPNSTYQQSGPPAFTGYMAPSSSFNIGTEQEYTFRWWGGAQNGGESGETHVFFAFGPNLNIHSAYLVDSGSPGNPAFRFKYVIQGIVVFDIGIPLTQRWNFYCVERQGPRIYFSLNGVWLALFTFGLSPIVVDGFPLYIGSDGAGRILNGEFNNFDFSNIAVYNSASNFTPPSSNLIADVNTIFLTAQGTNLTGLKIDQSGNGHNITTGPQASFIQDDPYGSVTDGGFLFV